MTESKETTSHADKEDDESIKGLFNYAMSLFKKIDSCDDPTNSDAVQLSIKLAIAKFEKVTNLVSMSGMFSSNESAEELPTETLQYLLLPAILGTLSLKLCGRPRKEVIVVAEIYFRDYLQRCKDYGITNVEIPQPDTENTPQRVYSEQAKIANLIQTREDKIRRFKEQKELQSKLERLELAVNSPTVDDEDKRDYFLSLIQSYILQSVDELNSIELEKPMLEFMEKRGAEPKPKFIPPTPLKPVIITRDAVQKAVFGAGYPALPSLTIEEFYDQRVREGTFPAACNIPHQTIQTAETSTDEADAIHRERLLETDDAVERARQMNMDEYKDDHRRGWGNRYNRS